MFIDTHAHLYMKEFDNDINEVIESAKSAYRLYHCPRIDIQTSFLAADLASNI
jgi:Tat protein secretion system quality control protein TatD with DNase activity